MALETTLTIKKLILMVILGICSAVWIVGGLLGDIDDFIVLEVEASSQSHSQNQDLIIGEGSSSLHWFVQVSSLMLINYG